MMTRGNQEKIRGLLDMFTGSVKRPFPSGPKTWMNKSFREWSAQATPTLPSSVIATMGSSTKRHTDSFIIHGPRNALPCATSICLSQVTGSEWARAEPDRAQRVAARSTASFGHLQPACGLLGGLKGIFSPENEDFLFTVRLHDKTIVIHRRKATTALAMNLVVCNLVRLIS